MAQLDAVAGPSCSERRTMKQIVVTGSECTGKSTLARALARHFRVPVVAEFARHYAEDLDRPLEVRDVEAIAHGQIEAQDRAADGSADLLVLDTDLLSTMVYAGHYYHHCPPWIAQAFEERRGDLYLLCDLDVPWVADGAQRDRGHRRGEMQDLFRQALEDHRLRFVKIAGSPISRLESALAALQRHDISAS